MPGFDIEKAKTETFQKLLPRINTLFKTGFFHIFGSNVINKILAFLSSVILVRILTKTEYGAFTYAILSTRMMPRFLSKYESNVILEISFL